jgi:hypothetical protein
MNYCTAVDVQGLAGYPIPFSDIVAPTSGSTKPTLAIVNSNITAITSEIDLYLSIVGITSQPTDSKILGKLKIGCMYGSAAMSGFGNLNQSGSTGGTKPMTFWDIYKEFLKEIVDNPTLYGITAGSESVSCGVNELHTEAENNSVMLHQNWKS